MRLSDGLKQRRADLLDRLEKLSQTAEKENRLFTADEAATWDAATAEARDLEQQIERQTAAENMRRNQPSQRRAIDDQGNAHLILRNTDKLADRFQRRDDQQFNIAKMLKGILTGNWSEAEYEQRAMSIGSLPGGGYAVPAELSAMWLDLARSKAVCIAAGAGTIPMSTATLRIAEILQDVAPTFRPENAALAENDVTFGAVDLKARLVGVVARASLELIADSPLANDMILTSITASLGLAMDHAMLSGDGVVSAVVDNPTGILTNANVNAIPVAAALADFDHFLDAMLMIEQANGTATSSIMNPAQNNELRKLVTGIAGDKTKLVEPEDFGALADFVTTGIPAGSAIVGNFTEGALFGMREGIVIEATRVGGTALSNAQVLIRGYARLDVGITRPKFFTKLTGITLAAAGASTRK